MSELNERVLGFVAVDSGQIAVGDPCGMDQIDMDDLDGSETLLRIPHSDWLAVAIVPTAWGDGLYPVTLHSDEEGRPVKLEIALTMDPTEDSAA